jgi:cystathionine beta-lyase
MSEYQLIKMKYNFDEIIDRRGTSSVKWDGVPANWNGRTDLLPMWVADMDFRTPPFVIDALRKRLEHEVIGYTFACDEWYEAIMKWVKMRFDWDVKREMITYSPGIVHGITFAILCFTQPGDKVMVTPPVYHPFFLMTERNHREVVWSPLVLSDGQYHIDFDRFRKDVKGCKLFILSNPHNPGGRVWTKEELQKIAEICAENGTLIISDEIHADLTLPPYKHHTFAKVSETALHHSLTFMAPSKAFNMPGLSSSYCIVEDDKIREQFFTFLNNSEWNEGHFLACIGAAAAYSHGLDWLNQVLAYIKANVEFLDKYLKENIPAIKAIIPQASYLVFLDCRDMHLSQERLCSFFEDGAHLALNLGTTFGKEGEGFMRLNVGCPRATLQKALTQLKEAYDKL